MNPIDLAILAIGAAALISIALDCGRPLLAWIRARREARGRTVAGRLRSFQRERR